VPGDTRADFSSSSCIASERPDVAGQHVPERSSSGHIRPGHHTIRRRDALCDSPR
jgi:hypothetical protein